MVRLFIYFLDWGGYTIVAEYSKKKNIKSFILTVNECNGIEMSQG